MPAEQSPFDFVGDAYGRGDWNRTSLQVVDSGHTLTHVFTSAPIHLKFFNGLHMAGIFVKAKRYLCRTFWGLLFRPPPGMFCLFRTLPCSPPCSLSSLGPGLGWRLRPGCARLHQRVHSGNGGVLLRRLLGAPCLACSVITSGIELSESCGLGKYKEPWISFPWSVRCRN